MSFHGKGGKTADVSVVTMNNKNVKRWVEVVEHIFLDDAIDGRHWVTGRALRMYPTIRKQLIQLGAQKDQIPRNGVPKIIVTDT